MTGRSVAVAVVAFMLVAGSASSAAASPYGSGGRDEIRVIERRERAQAAVEQARTDATTAPPPPAEVLYPACAGNTPDDQTDTMCPGLELGCPPGTFLVWVFQAPTGTVAGQPGWRQVGQRCSDPANVGVVQQPTVVTEAFFRTLPLPAPPVNVQPPDGYGWVTLRTNVYAEAQDPVVIDTELGGVRLQVRATPAMWSWDFGDGGTLGPTDEPGSAYPRLTNTHVYGSGGSYDIVMTTWYAGEFAVAGGPWQPVDGIAWADSAPTPFVVQTGHNVLVDDLDP